MPACLPARPSYEELAAENAELRAAVTDLRSVVEVLAEVGELKRQLRQDSAMGVTGPLPWATCC